MDRLSEGFIEERSQPRLPSYGWTSSELESAVNESGDGSSLSEGFIEDRSQPALPSYGWTSSELESAVNASGDGSSIEGVYRRPQPAARSVLWLAE